MEIRRAGLEIRKRWGAVRRVWREVRMEVRRVERLEAFSIIALGRCVSDGVWGIGCGSGGMREERGCCTYR